MSQIRQSASIVKAHSSPRLVYRILPVEDGVIKGLSLPGEDIKTLLSTSSKAVLFAATLGADAETLLMRQGIKNMADTVIMDAAMSCAIENVCDNFEFDMRKKAESGGLYLTDRFSPGYGDLPLNTQNALCEALNTSRRIGLTVTKNHLLIPRKSVTAIMGISSVPVTLRKRGCETCSMFLDCDYRKDGITCND